VPPVGRATASDAGHVALSAERPDLNSLVEVFDRISVEPEPEKAAGVAPGPSKTFGFEIVSKRCQGRSHWQMLGSSMQLRTR
jgi:hypothetical protein